MTAEATQLDKNPPEITPQIEEFITNKASEKLMKFVKESELRARNLSLMERREIDTRFQPVEKRISFMQWFMGAGFSIIVILMSLFKFLT